MARVRSIPSAELPPDLAAIYEDFAGQYGPFRNQVAVIAHVPAALRHLMPLLMELRTAATLPKRYLEIAIVVVSRLNECHYCVAHHKPFLMVAGVSAEAVDRIMEAELPAEFDAVDRLVIAYAKVAWETPNRVTARMHEALLEHFTEAQIVELTLRITLCGFFNRFNDALQIEEEAELHA
ncbi:carboxymuconolactone decarboxylase family protein [Sediminicoccus sp. KRV36]|uniref:carboxymuconolactone decarboxylase family protein n=1 Tax=Sediminicoccus sp. KRV36 TaxID=3133721 RepID=UPI00200F4B35|nr:carboxymuconolactone decarboxylase family protein [Sediminicoccus rosea]UPY37827.1 carboxymuconolactone decarboxylase family protein [Sediminicoccus rosea]